MKKMKWYEQALLYGAAAAVVFSGGFLAGRKSAGTRIVVQNSDLPLQATEPGDSSASSAALEAPGLLVNINTADAETLTSLPGIGPEKAAAIVTWREEHGDFSVCSELMNVSGIGESTYESLKPYITVEAPEEGEEHENTGSG